MWHIWPYIIIRFPLRRSDSPSAQFRSDAMETAIWVNFFCYARQRSGATLYHFLDRTVATLIRRKSVSDRVEFTVFPLETNPLSDTLLRRSTIAALQWKRSIILRFHWDAPIVLRRKSDSMSEMSKRLVWSFPLLRTLTVSKLRRSDVATVRSIKRYKVAPLRWCA